MSEYFSVLNSLLVMEILFHIFTGFVCDQVWSSLVISSWSRSIWIKFVKSHWSSLGSIPSEVKACF